MLSLSQSKKILIMQPEFPLLEFSLVETFPLVLFQDIVGAQAEEALRRFSSPRTICAQGHLE